MYENIITKVDEITEAKVINSTNPFYVFLFSNDGESTTIICNGIPTYQKSKDLVPIPLTAMVWNPIALTDIEVSADMLSNYRIFIGYIK